MIKSKLFCLPGTTEQDGESTAAEAAKPKTCNDIQQPQQVCYVQIITEEQCTKYSSYVARE